jgi:hypothetical protein
MGVDQLECGAGRASPAKWSVVEYWQKKTSQNVDVGCNLVVLERAPPQPGCKSVARRAIQSAWCFGLKMRCASFYFERSCPEQRPRAALKPQEPHSSGPWTPGAPAEVLASRGVMGSWQAAGVIFVVGEVVLTLHPPLRALSHNVNPRDGAQDTAWSTNNRGGGRGWR